MDSRSDHHLKKLSRMARSSTGKAWRLVYDEAGRPVVSIERGDGSDEPMLVQHDGRRAPDGNIVFVASCRADVITLINMIEGRRPADSVELREIARRHQDSTPGEWWAFLESTGGIGGESIISFRAEGAPPEDLYLSAYGEGVPDGDYEFVAAAHEGIPRLLAELISSGEPTGS